MLDYRHTLRSIVDTALILSCVSNNVSIRKKLKHLRDIVNMH